jgi:hypothetical protein
MSNVTVTRYMSNVTPEQVFSAVTELHRLADWNRSVSSSEPVGAERGVGAQVSLTLPDGHQMTEEITSYDPVARRHTFIITNMPAPFASMTGDMSCTPAEGGCEFRFETDYTLRGGIFGAAIDVLVLRAALRKEHERILEDLEHHLSTGEHIGQDGQRLAAAKAAASA